jgi:hypothetical protein
MNVEIGAEAALFPEKEYINGIFVAVQKKQGSSSPISTDKQILSRSGTKVPVQPIRREGHKGASSGN